MPPCEQNYQPEPAAYRRHRTLSPARHLAVLLLIALAVMALVTG